MKQNADGTRTVALGFNGSQENLCIPLAGSPTST